MSQDVLKENGLFMIKILTARFYVLKWNSHTIFTSLKLQGSRFWYIHSFMKSLLKPNFGHFYLLRKNLIHQQSSLCIPHAYSLSPGQPQINLLSVSADWHQPFTMFLISGVSTQIKVSPWGLLGYKKQLNCTCP